MIDLVAHADWLGIILSLTAYFLLARHRRTALVILTASNVVWGTWAVARGVTSISLLNLAYLAMNARTLLIWRSESNSSESAPSRGASKRNAPGTG